MSLAIVYSRASMGVQAPLVTIEVHLSNGKPGFTLVGLPEKTVKEAQDRVRSALINAQFKYPAKRITVNLAPADLPKEGGRFDLPIMLLLTKADKLSQSARSKQVKMVREAILPFQGDIQVEAFSAQNKIGIDKLAAKLDSWFSPLFS